ncbi:FHA domain-containing protein, partial [Microbacterium dextranolyticum]|uniref:FHA domain-containing protein n=1 Tax=Microbacterium dextranolyticum TaxID=36806 RepID=UPI0031E31EFF
AADAAPEASVIDALPPGLRSDPPAEEDDSQVEPASIGRDDDRDDAPPAVPDTSADTLLPEATAAEVEPAPADEYDMLWGETVARPISAAAIASADPDADPAAASEAPAAAEPARAASRSEAFSADLGDHDGATIAVADLRAMRAERAEREAFESTDNVPARRPARGRIRLSTGRVVELERPVVIGRRPKSTRTSGAELPTLVAVDSPEQDISRSHVEIRAEGEHVLVIDLDTTNGTILLRGGHEPVRLHPGEPTMVVTGDVLDLGDDVTVTFEDLP